MRRGDFIPLHGPHRRRRQRERRKRQHRRFALAGALAAVLLLAALTLAGGGVLAYDRLNDCTLAGKRPQLRLGENSFVYAADGSLLGMIASEYRREPVPYDEISPWLVQATVAIEDRRFWLHGGVDRRAVARAALHNLQAREVREGGSTIDQQLVRLLYLDQSPTLERKRQEACLALRVNEVWSKQFIMRLYLNRVYFGNGAYGVEAAARTYFSSRAHRLGPAQAALLAGLIQNPSRHDPFADAEAARERRNEVLLAMREEGYLTAEQYRVARGRPLGVQRGRLYAIDREPYAVEYVRRTLVEAYGEEVVKHGGLRVYTTIDRRYQALARRTVRGTLGRPSDPATALVSINPSNGAVRAMVSHVPGASGRASEFNLATQARRQAGSSFKTFVLAEAIRRGANPWTTRYISRPFTYEVGPNNVWEVETYSGESYGLSSLVAATLRSDNTVYAQLILDLGPASVARLAARMGVASPLEPVPSLGLGSVEVTPVDLASGYATLAAGGVYHRPFVIRRVEFADRRIDRHDSWGSGEPRRVLEPIVAHHVTTLLEQNVEGGTGTAARLDRPVAGKTGTTEDHADAWFVGYTPQLATAVWVGFPRARVPMTNVRGIRVAGGTFPAQMWGAYSAAVHRGAPARPFVKPPGAVDWKPFEGRFAAGAGEDFEPPAED